MRHTSSMRMLILCISAFGAGQGFAQETPKESPDTTPKWANKFDNVEIKVINPEDLPKAEESIMPAALSKQTTLPRPTTLEMLRKSSAEISDRVIEVLVVPHDDSPIRQTPIVVRGEAVWLSAKANSADPILVTNAHYLIGADAVFVRPAEKRRAAALPTAQRRSLNQMSLGADVKALLKDPTLIKVAVEHIDKHRNLATLVAEPAKLPTPPQGVAFFPIEEQAVGAVYGFSHQMGSTLVQTSFLAPSNKREELEFYMHSTFPVILGAPIVADDGRVIAITAARHPNEPDRTLVIPPRALRRYVAAAQGVDMAAADARN